MGVLRKAYWWAADYLYGGWMHVRALSLHVPKHYRLGDADKPIILILPGVYETWSFLKPVADRLNEAGYRVSVVRGLGYNLLPIVETAARLNRALRRLDTPRAGRILVAHSKGGLVGKQLMIMSGRELRIRGLIAIATPFQGSRYARFVLDPYLRTFMPTNETIVALGAEASVNAEIVSVFGAFDPHVPDGSELTGAKNVPLDVAGHFRILRAPETLDAVEQAAVSLAESVPSRAPSSGEGSG
jgi:pimeloyl-ACP methyl ester carboxylesterase